MSLTFQRTKRVWDRLKSGIYVPPLLKRVHRDEDGGWYPCCTGDGRECPYCSGIVPAQFSVVVPDLYKGIGACNECDELEGTYIVDWYEYEDPWCVYYYELPATICTVNAVWVELGEGPNAVLYLRTGSPPTKGDTVLSWTRIVGSLPELCSSWDNESLGRLVEGNQCKTVSSASITTL